MQLWVALVKLFRVSSTEPWIPSKQKVSFGFHGSYEVRWLFTMGLIRTGHIFKYIMMHLEALE